MTLKELFDFVTDPTVNESNMDEYLEKAMELTSTRSEITEKEKVDNEVSIFWFLSLNISFKLLILINMKLK
jgi:hypothetical protein